VVITKNQRLGKETKRKKIMKQSFSGLPPLIKLHLPS
jgi:hypothetical protein